MTRVYFFGCWNEPGHFMFAPGRRSVLSAERQGIEFYGGDERIHIDGSIAPRKARDGSLCWAGQGKTRDERQRVRYGSGEYPQGQFLIHHLDTGFTAMSWWDRCQGDKRPGCSSTVLFEGKHDAVKMSVVLAEHFPHVLENLKKHGVELVEVPGGTR